jgi:predicted aldo/keto reductase-like oxidoreductase
MKRRSFLKSVSATVGTGVAVSGVVEQKSTAAAESVNGLPRRQLGDSNKAVSIVAFPGLALVHHEQEECNEACKKAFEQGVNHFDVAPAYGKGDCEIKMGVGLQGLPRDEIFLSCKTKMRDKAGAREELERSLERLKTDRFDLYQLHCLMQPDEVEQSLGPGGAMETILEAQREGKIGMIGFSAHTTPAALAAMKGFDFDTAMFPINFVEYYLMGFGKPLIEMAEEKGTSILAIKALSRGAWPEGMERTRKWWYRCMESEDEVDLAMRFTLSLPQVKTAIPPSWLDLLDKSIDSCKSYSPITEEETEQLRVLAEASNSLFQRQENAVAHRRPAGCPFADNPHDPSVERHA